MSGIIVTYLDIYINDGDFNLYDFKFIFEDDGHLKEDEYMKMTGDAKAKADFMYKHFDLNHDGDITKFDVNGAFKMYDHNGKDSMNI